jgi:hypothetical protein
VTLAAQMVGKKVKSSAAADGQIVAAVEITSATNISSALSTFERQIKNSRSDMLVIAVKV